MRDPIKLPNRMRTAMADPALTARVTRTVPLHYDEGADTGLDRPAHVRSGSSLAWVPGGIVVIQDDANFLAVFDPAGRRTRAITLPGGKDGLRRFDSSRGNKKHRLDLEACVALDAGGASMLLAFGSGSSRRREQVLRVRDVTSESPEVTLMQAPLLYAALRAETAFSGSELNIEGAIQVGGRVRLFSRGNGAPRRGRTPVDATCDLDLEALLAHLAQPDGVEVPVPGEVVQYQLGVIEGVPLGFTDAAGWRGSMLYSAAAEASPDATQDGPVTGSAIGVIDATGRTRWAPLTDATGARFPGKVEGLVAEADGSSSLLVVLDADDPGTATELCTVELAGPWSGPV
jgi:hypothetical protein